MGRGNYCPIGDLTDQWYIDYDNYRYEADEEGNEAYAEIDYDECDNDIVNTLYEVKLRFPSFEECDRWSNTEHGRYWNEHILLENMFFEIGTADNEWAEAIFIHEKDMWPEEFGLAKKHFEEYRKGIKEILLDNFGAIHLRCGPWTSERITKVAKYA